MYTNITRYILIISGLFLFIHAGAQDTAAVMELTLEQAQACAVENNYDIKNARLDIEIAGKKVWETAAIGLPQVSGSVSYQNIFTVPVMTMGGSIAVAPDPPDDQYYHYHEEFEADLELGVKENTTYSINATQLIFNGEYIVGLQAAKLYKLLSAQNLENTKKNIKEIVAQAYFLVLMATENKGVLVSSLKNIEKIISETEKMYNAGFMEETDVDQLKLTGKNMENSVRSLERQTDLGEDLLKLQMGLPLEAKISLTETLDGLMEKTAVDVVSEQAFVLEDHISYKLLTTQENLSLLNLRREKATLLPTISAFYTHQELMNKPEFNFIPPDILGVSVVIPVFSSGMKLSKISKARLELEKARYTKEQVARSLELGVNQARSDFLNAYEKFLNVKEAKELSKKIFDKTSVKFKEGMASSFELTQAQNQYLLSESNYYNAVFELLNAKNKLDTALNIY